MLCSQLSRTSGVGCDLSLPRLIPEREFDPVPESEFVIDDSEIVLDDVFRRADGICDLAVLESLGDKLDNSRFPFAGYPVSVTLPSEHSCLR